MAIAIDRGWLNRWYPIWLPVVLGVLLSMSCQSSAPPFECTDAIGCVHVAPDQPIKLAALQALSGGVRDSGVDHLRAVELAVAQRSKQLLGHEIKLQIEDTGCSSEGGAIAAAKVVSDPQIIGILGTSCSVAAVRVAKIMSEAGFVMISGGNTAPSLTSVRGARGGDWQPGYFRTIYNDVDQGRAAATFAFQELGVRKVATINDGDPYTRGLTDVFGQIFTELGGEIVLATTINKGDTNMQPVLMAVAAAEAELVFIPIFHPEGSYIVQQAKQLDQLSRTILLSADGLLQADFFETVGKDGIGVYFVGPDTPTSDAYETFIAQYKATFSEPPIGPYHTHAYDAANLLMETIAMVSVQEPDGTLHIGRQALRDALYATKDFKGLTGRLKADAFGDCGVARFKVMRLQDSADGLEGLANNVVYTYTRDE